MAAVEITLLQDRNQVLEQLMMTQSNRYIETTDYLPGANNRHCSFHTLAKGEKAAVVCFLCCGTSWRVCVCDVCVMSKRAATGIAGTIYTR